MDIESLLNEEDTDRTLVKTESSRPGSSTREATGLQRLSTGTSAASAASAVSPTSAAFRGGSPTAGFAERRFDPLGFATDLDRPLSGDMATAVMTQPAEEAGEGPAGLPKNLACSNCDKKFARRSDLVRHERIHSGVRPHACPHPDCGKTFIQRSALTVHERTHTGQKPHECDQCGKPFSDSSSLARHRRTHSGARPYHCDFPGCSKQFTRKTTLTRHKQQHSRKGHIPIQEGTEDDDRKSSYSESVPGVEAMDAEGPIPAAAAHPRDAAAAARMYGSFAVRAEEVQHHSPAPHHSGPPPPPGYQAPSYGPEHGPGPSSYQQAPYPGQAYPYPDPRPGYGMSTPQASDRQTSAGYEQYPQQATGQGPYYPAQASEQRDQPGPSSYTNPYWQSPQGGR